MKRKIPELLPPSNKNCPFCGKSANCDSTMSGKTHWYYCHHRCFEQYLHNDELYEYMDKYENGKQ